MPLGTNLLNFAVRHPAMTAAPLVGGGAYLAARGATDSESLKRRLQLGAAAGGLAAMAIPGVRQGASRVLKRQIYGLTGKLPANYKPSAATVEAVAKAKRGEVLGKVKPSMFSKLRYGKDEAMKRAQIAAKKSAAESAAKLNKLKMTNADLHWLELHGPSALENPSQMYELMHAHGEGMSTLPGVVKNLRHPTQFVKKWWKTTPTGGKLMIGGFTGAGIYQGAKSGEPGGVGDAIGNNLGWFASGAAPISVWMPMSLAGGAAGKLIGSTVSKLKSGPQVPGVTAPNTQFPNPQYLSR